MVKIVISKMIFKALFKGPIYRWFLVGNEVS